MPIRLSHTAWPSARRFGHRIVSGTLRCRQCSRDAGDLVGYADRSIAEARFVPPTSGYLPCLVGSHLRCGRCMGQLYLDDVETLGRSVPLEEVGDLALAQVVTDDDVSIDSVVA